MAVTLTSTGITFSDGSTQNAAAAGGATGSYQAFNNSGTWSRPAGVNVVGVSLCSGSGGGGGNSGWQNSGGGIGGTGACNPSLWKAVTGNLSITVGGGGSAGNSSTYGPNNGGAGGASNAASIQANGGNGGNRAHTSVGNPGGTGSGIVSMPGAAGGNRSAAGRSGWVTITW